MSLRTRRMAGGAFTALSGLAVLAVVAMLGVILWDVLRHGWAQMSWQFLTRPPAEGMTEGGILPAIYGTALLTLLMTVAVMPVGVVTAVYLREYAPPASRLAGLVRGGAALGLLRSIFWPRAPRLVAAARKPSAVRGAPESTAVRRARRACTAGRESSRRL